MMRTARPQNRLVSLATAYADQSANETDDQNDELVIPEDFSELNNEELASLSDRAVEAFDHLYGDGTADYSDEELELLDGLTQGIEALATEKARRDELAAERAARAAELASRVRGDDSTDDSADGEGGGEGEGEGDGEDSGDEDETDGDEDEAGTEDDNAAETVTASGQAATPPSRKAMRMPMKHLRATSAANAAAARRSKESEPSITDVLVASGEGLGVPANTGVDWLGAGRALDHRLGSYNSSAYSRAAATGHHLREQHSLVSIKRPIPEELTIRSNDAQHVDEVIDRATSESRLPQGSLVASGGWCAPSETLYDLIEMESRDGLLSLPEIGVARGGVQFTKGPSFQEIFSDIEGFRFTEAQDIAGEYARDGSVGPKPCYKVDCPEFEEHRLDVEGLCISSGLLASKGYPEYLARVLRGALVAHDHRMNGLMLKDMADGSTAVTMPSVQAGATAPILTSIELQVEHYKYTHRLSRSTTLEAIFPFWVRGAIRADLARRTGVELLAVTDAQIQQWFTSRGVSAQYVYNWQTIDGTATSAFTQWPNTVSFLLYSAGTWLRGAAPLITIDSLYDSSLIENNDFTALFTEEGYFVAQRGLDSRVVSLQFAADGATHMGIDIEHSGVAAAAPTGA